MTVPISNGDQPAPLTRLQQIEHDEDVRADWMRTLQQATHADLDDPAQEKPYHEGLGDR